MLRPFCPVIVDTSTMLKPFSVPGAENSALQKEIGTVHKELQHAQSVNTRLAEQSEETERNHALVLS